MGGMLDKLVDNGNDVSVAYMTNGSVAVFDADVRRYLRFADLSGKTLNLEGEGAENFRKRRDEIVAHLEQKKPGEVDPPDVQTLKAYIRYGEAIAAIEVMGLDADDAKFLDMPFYRTGRVRKDPISDADVDVVYDLLEDVNPTHIFVAGDLSDPHGTHRMCYKAIKEALARYNQDTTPPTDDASTDTDSTSNARPSPLVWLYRGAWQEWPLHEADVFVPLSKADLDRKVEAIFKHESQKDRAMFPGAYDDREFWERARDRNRGTADELNRLGLPEFYAAEAFVTTYDMP
jgi:glucosamine-6-phosphate deaminase